MSSERAPKSGTDGTFLTSVYQVARTAAMHPAGWEQAARVAIAEAAQTITDLRIARVESKDVIIDDAGVRQYRVTLAVSYRIDRQRVLPSGVLATVRRYLVVANQSLDSDVLHRALRERAAAGPSEFHVVAPVKLPGILNAALFADPTTGYAFPDAYTQVENDAVAEARARLDEALIRIRATGAGATGEVSAADPAAATAAVLERSSFDEILVSIMASSVSRWLRIDLPTRLARVTRTPVTEIRAPD